MFLETFHSLFDYCRIKDIQQTLNRQTDLLRLIVQKMEIVEEVEDRDEDYIPDDEARTRGTIRQVHAAVNAFKKYT